MEARLAEFVQAVSPGQVGAGRTGESQCILLGVALTVFIIGAAAFQVRDIQS